MNSITIITSLLIDSSISKEIIDGFPFSKKIVVDTQDELFLGKSPNEIILHFDEYYEPSSTTCIFDDVLLTSIPFSPIYFNTLYFRNIDSAKFVISVLAKKYENILIFDEDSNYFITTKEFLNK